MLANNKQINNKMSNNFQNDYDNYSLEHPDTEPLLQEYVQTSYNLIPVQYLTELNGSTQVLNGSSQVFNNKYSSSCFFYDPYLSTNSYVSEYDPTLKSNTETSKHNTVTIDDKIKHLIPLKINFSKLMNIFASYDDKDKMYVVKKYYKKLLPFQKVPENYINKIDLINITKYINDKAVVKELYFYYKKIVKLCDNTEKIILLTFLDDSDKINFITEFNMFSTKYFTFANEQDAELFLRLYDTVSDNDKTTLTNMFSDVYLGTIIELNEFLKSLSNNTIDNIVRILGTNIGNKLYKYYELDVYNTITLKKIEWCVKKFNPKIEYYVLYSILEYCYYKGIVVIVYLEDITFNNTKFIKYLTKYKIYTVKQELNYEEKSSINRIIKSTNFNDLPVLLKILDSIYFDNTKNDTIISNFFSDIIKNCSKDETNYDNSIIVNNDYNIVKYVCDNYTICLQDFMDILIDIKETCNNQQIINLIVTNVLVNNYDKLLKCDDVKKSEYICNCLIVNLNELIKNGKAKPDLEGKAKPDLKGKAKPDLEGKAKPDLKGKAKPDLEGKAKPDLEGKAKPDPKCTFNFDNYEYSLNYRTIKFLFNKIKIINTDINDLISTYRIYLCYNNNTKHIEEFETRVLSICEHKIYYARQFYNYHYTNSNLSQDYKLYLTNLLVTESNNDNILMSYNSVNGLDNDDIKYDENIIKKIVCKDNLLTILKNNTKNKHNIIKIFAKKEMATNEIYDQYIFSILEDLVPFFEDSIYELIVVLSKYVNFKKYVYCLEKNRELFKDEYNKIIKYIQN